jgi:hypothetical protein
VYFTWKEHLNNASKARRRCSAQDKKHVLILLSLQHHRKLQANSKSKEVKQIQGNSEEEEENIVPIKTKSKKHQ